MYADLSGYGRVCPRTYDTIFLGSSRSIQADVSRSYRDSWSRFVSWDLSQEFC
jgi:hypothetical protein